MSAIQPNCIDFNELIRVANEEVNEFKKLLLYEKHKKEYIDVQFKTGNEVINNQLIHGENLEILTILGSKDKKKGIDLMYIDPLYMSDKIYYRKIYINNNKNKCIEQLMFIDKWKLRKSRKIKLEAYLKELTKRLLLMKNLLRDGGSLYLHVNDISIHYIKIILDEIFGWKSYQNTIVWKKNYVKKIPGCRYFREGDQILFYTKNIKSKNYFNPPERELTEEEKKQYPKEVDPGTYCEKTLKKLEKEGKAKKDENDEWCVIITEEDAKRAYGDIWTDIASYSSASKSKDRAFYETEKPRKLLERIIETSSDKDNIIADFYCGTGITGRVASTLKRQWILSDINMNACITTIRKMLQENIEFIFRYFKELDSNLSTINLERRSEENIMRFILRSVSWKNTDKLLQTIKPEGKDILINCIDNKSTCLIELWAIGKQRDANTIEILEYKYLKNEKKYTDCPIDIEIKINKDTYNKNKLVIFIADVFGNVYLENIDIN